MKLSIIVPVYNVENYLRKCVDSLLAQDISDYEMILVDDGSTDNSGAICDNYASPVTGNPSPVTPLIRVIHQPNGGLSAARNSGIKVAQGEYIMFVDSDDYIEPNLLGALVKRMDEEHLDVLRYNYRNVRMTDSVYEEFSPNKDPKRDVDYSESVVDGETFLNERLGPGCYAWQFILHRDLLLTPYTLHSTQEKDNCLFTEGIYFEDTEWTPRLLLKAKRVASTTMVVYNYLWRTGSITLPTDPLKRKKVIEDKIALIRGFQDQQKFVQDPKWFVWMTSMTTMGVLGMLAKMSAEERKPYLNELKDLHIFPLITSREKILSHRMKIRLANISPNLYCILMNLRK